MGKKCGYTVFKSRLLDFCEEIWECSDEGIAEGEEVGQDICDPYSKYLLHLDIPVDL